MIIKIVYTFFLALLIALFVGLGIDAFYNGPERPEYPIELEVPEKEKSLTQEQKNLRLQYKKDQRSYQEELKTYNRNVSIISLSASIIILILSLTLLSKIKMIADGVLLGGVFTAIYSIIRGIMVDDSKFRFIVVTVGLMIALVLGYIIFIRPKEKKASK